MSAAKPVTLGVVASSLHVGGAEQLLLELLRRLDRTRFEPRLYLLAEPGPVGREVLKLGLPCRADILARGSKATAPLRLARLLREDGVGAILFINHRNALFHGVPAARLAGIRAVVNWENETFKRYRFHGLFMALRRLLDTGVDACVAAARGHANYIVEQEGVPARKVLPIVNAVDPERFASALTREQAKAKLGIPPERPTAGILAVLRPDKAHDLFLRAASRVAPETDGHFLVIGDGPRRVELETLARELGLADRVGFLGFKREGLADVLAALDLVCLSSKPLQETLSVAALEAMSTGIPMLSTRVGYMDEIVLEGRTGRLVASGDLDGYAAALRRLLLDGEERREMGRQAARLVRERYSLEAMARGFEDLFGLLLGPDPDLARLRPVEAARACLLPGSDPAEDQALAQTLRPRLNAVGMAPGRSRGPLVQALAALWGMGRHNLLVSRSTAQALWLGLLLRPWPRRRRPGHLCLAAPPDPGRDRLAAWALPGIDAVGRDTSAIPDDALLAKALGGPESGGRFPGA